MWPSISHIIKHTTEQLQVRLEISAVVLSVTIPAVAGSHLMFTLDLKTSCLQTPVDSDDGVVDTCPVGGDGNVSPPLCLIKLKHTASPSPLHTAAT